MATSDVTKTASTQAADAGSLPALAGEARELKRFMSNLANQIAETELRHGEALTTAREKLGGLNEMAQGPQVRRSLSPSGVLERIEGSMAQQSSQGTNPSAQAASTLETFTRRSYPVAPARADEADHHDGAIVDPDAADALARLYESGVHDPAGAPALDAVTSGERAPSSTSHPMFSSTPSQADAGTNGNDRAWLENRFAEVAAKLEHTLTNAMSRAVRSDDLISLRSIENQVEDLGAQLVAVQTHFSRLDSIELELRSLAERMSPDQISRLIQSGTSKLSDKDALSAAVAAGVAQQMPRIEHALKSIANLVAEGRSTPSMDGDEAPATLGDLKATLESFVVEQRHGDQQVNTMLDTMQQAMIRLLDRVDAIEQSRYASGDESDELDLDYRGPTSYEPQPSVLSTEDGHEVAVPMANHQQVEPELSVHEPASHQLPHLPEPPRAPEPEGPAPRPTLTSLAPSSLRASIQQTPGGAIDSSAQSSSATRESFVAAARRAARMAADAPEEQALAAEGAPATGKSRRSRLWSSDRKLSPVAMALICLTLVGATFIAVKSTILAPRSPQPSATESQPQSQPGAQSETRRQVDKSIQNLEDADGPVAPRPDDPQRRSSIQGQQGSDQEAKGLPANGGAVPQIQGAQPLPAALTQNVEVGEITPKAGEMPPLAIGPNSLRTAASKGEPSAEFEVGARFAEGRGVPQDLQQAVQWYQRAASQGFAPAQYRLGSMYERGLGVKADLARARVWYQRAAEQGIVKAMHNLAVLTAGRDSAVTDYAAAGKWFHAAADYGLTDSQFNLAIMYDSGLGMERDAKQAFKWFSLAARAGDEEAARRRDSLRSKLQPKELAETESEISGWRPKSADQALNDPRLAGEAWKKGAR